MVENAQLPTSTVILQQQQQQAVYHDNVDNNLSNNNDQCSQNFHHHQQNQPHEWSEALQNCHPNNMVEHSVNLPSMDVVASTGFESFVSTPQTLPSAATYYLQSSATMQPSQCAVSPNDAVYHVTQQQTQPLAQHDAICTAVTSSIPSSYYQPHQKYSPTTVLDLGSGTIHRSLEQNCGDNECGQGWPHFQSSTSLSHKPSPYHHQFYEETLGDRVVSAENINHHQRYKTINETDIKTEIDSNDVSEHSLDLQIYSMEQISDVATHGVNYYSQHQQISSCSSSNVTDTTNSVSINFTGDVGVGCSSIPDTSLVENYIVLDSNKLLNNNDEIINNNYFGEPFCDTETNSTANVFNEFQLNTVSQQWSQSTIH